VLLLLAILSVSDPSSSWRGLMDKFIIGSRYDTIPEFRWWCSGRSKCLADNHHKEEFTKRIYVQDSYILASLLSSLNSKASIQKVAEVYDAVRCGPANSVAEISRIAGVHYHLCGPGFESVVEGDTSVTANQIKVSLGAIGKMWEPILRESLEDSRKRAVTMLQEQCTKV